MIPRKPPEPPRGDAQDDVLQAIHEALNEAPPPSEPSAELVEAAKPDDAAQSPGDKTTEVEMDRAELYRRGPTVFTA